MKYLLLVLAIATLASCIHLGDRTKAAAIEATAGVGAAVGKTSSEFVKGVKDGIDQTFGCQLTLSDQLKKSGISTGKFLIHTDSTATVKNLVSVYLIFEKDYNGTISARVTDKGNKEYGRTSVTVKAKKDQAFYVDLFFDKRTDIEGNSTITLQ